MSEKDRKPHRDYSNPMSREELKDLLQNTGTLPPKKGLDEKSYRVIVKKSRIDLEDY